MRHFWSGLLLAVLLLAGCSDAAGPGAADSDGSKGAGKAAAEIPLSLMSWDELQHWVAGRQGKVVVIDVWSTYCQPCIKEFPHFVELHRDHADRVACASLSVDYYGGKGKPEDVRPQVLKFLSSQGATMQNFICSDPDEVVLGHINTTAIPAVLVYDQQGKLHKVFNNDKDEYGPQGFSYAENIVPLVEELLAGSG